MLKESDYRNIPSKNWTISHVCDWLTSFGMGRYIEAFSANEINGSLLLNSVDEQALEIVLGISSGMHRNRILTQIVELQALKILEIERQRANVKKEEEEHKLKIGREKEEHKLSGGMMWQQLIKFTNVMESLQDVGLQQHIKLPRIAVLGTQSSGKTSVLESILGLDFLPKGDDVCTRCPLELQFRHIADPKTKMWVEFDDIKTKKFVDLREVCGIISKLTEKVAGENEIVERPIKLTVYSHTCANLTLIDLPGIRSTPVNKWERTDKEEITKAITLRYVRDPRTIMVVVIPANEDLATSEALKISKHLDPKGIRTVGVISKLDIMYEGTKAKRILQGHLFPLRFGYVGVKNRSQTDIASQISLPQALEIESYWFGTHPVYSQLSEDIPHQVSLASNKIRYSGKITECSTKLKDLGDEIPSEDSQKMKLLWNMVNDFCIIYKDIIPVADLVEIYNKKRTSYYGINESIELDNMIAIDSEHEGSMREQDNINRNTRYNYEYTNKLHNATTPEDIKKSEEFVKKKCENKISMDDSFLPLLIIKKQLESNGTRVIVQEGSSGDMNMNCLHMLTSGMAHMKHYSYKFEENENLSYDQLDKNQSQRERFLSKFKKTIGICLEIEETEIDILGIHRGSIKVEWRLKNDEIGDKKILDNEKLLSNKLKEKFGTNVVFELHPYFKQMNFSEDLMDPLRGNREEWGYIDKRSGLDYFPPEGWKGYGLNVIGKYDDGEDDWLAMNGNSGEWAVAYHGLRGEHIGENSLTITKEEFKAGEEQAYHSTDDINHPGEKVGKGIYVGQTIEVAEQYTAAVDVGGQKYKVAFMCRINPSKLRIPESNTDYWVLPGGKDIRPYRILLKKS